MNCAPLEIAKAVNSDPMLSGEREASVAEEENPPQVPKLVFIIESKL